MKTILHQLRVLAIIEGISYLLFAFTMPLKYMYDIVLPNKIVGIIHGILFIAYCIWVLLVARKFEWKLVRTLICLVASLLPIATFIVDSKILREESKKFEQS